MYLKKHAMKSFKKMQHSYKTSAVLTPGYEWSNSEAFQLSIGYDHAPRKKKKEKKKISLTDPKREQ